MALLVTWYSHVKREGWASEYPICLNGELLFLSNLFKDGLKNVMKKVFPKNLRILIINWFLSHWVYAFGLSRGGLCQPADQYLSSIGSFVCVNTVELSWIRANALIWCNYSSMILLSLTGIPQHSHVSSDSSWDLTSQRTSFVVTSKKMCHSSKKLKFFN